MASDVHSRMMMCFLGKNGHRHELHSIALFPALFGLAFSCSSRSAQGAQSIPGHTAYPTQQPTDLGVDQIQFQAQIATLERQYSEAIRILCGALKRHPGETALQLELGRAYSAIGDDRKAERFFLEILAKEPENRPAQLELARTLGYQSRYVQSNRIYRHLLSLNPADEAAAIGLASNLLHEHRPGEAAAVADAGLSYHANSLRLLEFKDRIAGVLGGEERPLPITRNVFTAAADYINDSAGNHSWRATERLESRLIPELTSDLHFEQDNSPRTR